MKNTHRLPRFFIDAVNPDKEKNIIIKGDEFHHMRNVVRLKAGDDFIVFDGKGNDCLAELKTLGKKEASTFIKQRLVTTSESKLKIVLAQGIAKGERMEIIIQKAAELGASSVIPFISARTVPILKGSKETKKVERWQRIAIESSKQSGRSFVPKIEPIRTYDEMPLGWDKYLKIILWEDSDRFDLKEAMMRIKKADYQGIIVIVGPEGGLSGEEVLLAERHGFLSTRLFANILRVETAAISILSIIKYEVEV